MLISIPGSSFTIAYRESYKSYALRIETGYSEARRAYSRGYHNWVGRCVECGQWLPGETFGAALVNRAPAVALPSLGPSGFDPLAFGQQAGLRTPLASAPGRCAIT
jgi:hypothetical protein